MTSDVPPDVAREETLQPPEGTDGDGEVVDEEDRPALPWPAASAWGLALAGSILQVWHLEQAPLDETTQALLGLTLLPMGLLLASSWSLPSHIQTRWFVGAAALVYLIPLVADRYDLEALFSFWLGLLVATAVLALFSALRPGVVWVLRLALAATAVGTALVPLYWYGQGVTGGDPFAWAAFARPTAIGGAGLGLVASLMRAVPPGKG